MAAVEDVRFLKVREKYGFEQFNKVLIAAAYLSRRRRELRDGTWRPHAIASSGRLLVRSYSERWIAKRKKDGVKTVDKDEQRLRDYILPAIGDKPLDSVRRADRARSRWARASSPRSATATRAGGRW